MHNVYVSFSLLYFVYEEFIEIEHICFSVGYPLSGQSSAGPQPVNCFMPLKIWPVNCLLLSSELKK